MLKKREANLGTVCLLIAVITLPGSSFAFESPKTILVAILDGEETPPAKIAIDRLWAYSSAEVEVVHGQPGQFDRDADLVVSLGVG